MSGKDYMDVTGIDQIANLVSLLMTKFNFVKDEFKMQRWEFSVIFSPQKIVAGWPQFKDSGGSWA